MNQPLISLAISTPVVSSATTSLPKEACTNGISVKISNTAFEVCRCLVKSWCPSFNIITYLKGNFQHLQSSPARQQTLWYQPGQPRWRTCLTSGWPGLSPHPWAWQGCQWTELPGHQRASVQAAVQDPKTGSWVSWQLIPWGVLQWGDWLHLVVHCQLVWRKEALQGQACLKTDITANVKHWPEHTGATTGNYNDIHELTQ